MGGAALTVTHSCMMMVVAWPLSPVCVRVASMVARPHRVARLSAVASHHQPPASLPWHAVARLSGAVGQGLCLELHLG